VQRLIALLIGVLLAACVSTPRGATALEPTWRLSPRDLPAPLALQQQLTIERGGESRRFEALLEADTEALNLAVLAMGQPALTLRWDGAVLKETRADWLPPQLRGRDVLDDLQLALWPLNAVTRAAPPGWRVAEQGTTRRVFDGDTLVVVVDRVSANELRIERPMAGYTLRIQSIDLGSADP
jgi:hypothetical protein